MSLGTNPAPDEGSESIEPRRTLVDRVGDWSMSMTGALLRNPALAIALGTVVLFAVARIPTEIFYNRFGVRPEDAGLNSVQVLLQGTTTVLVSSLAIGVAYGLLVPLLLGLYLSIGGSIATRLKKPSLKNRSPGADKFSARLLRLADRDKEITRKILRLAPLVVPLSSICFAIFVLTFRAMEDADALHSGILPVSRPLPWIAKRVSVFWERKSDPSVSLPGCRWLIYLGEGGGRVLLYDSKRDQTYRIATEDIQLVFPGHCDG